MKSMLEKESLQTLKYTREFRRPLSFCKDSLPHSEIIGHIDSPIKGTDGNKEFLVGLTKSCIVTTEQ